jgi:hypothetical protein
MVNTNLNPTEIWRLTAKKKTWISRSSLLLITAQVTLSENIKVVFLPPNTTPLLQPMDQGVIATFKVYYLCRTFAKLTEATDGENKPSEKELGKNCNIKDAIYIIIEAW